MLQNPIGNLGIEFGEAFFRDTSLGPKDALGVSETLADWLDGIGCRFLRRRLKRDLLRRPVFAQALEGCLPNELVRRPSTIFDFANELWFGPADRLFRASRHGIP